VDGGLHPVQPVRRPEADCCREAAMGGHHGGTARSGANHPGVNCALPAVRAPRFFYPRVAPGRHSCELSNDRWRYRILEAVGCNSALWE
jgi:hypothetical protein